MDDGEAVMVQVLGRRTDQLWEETFNLSLNYCKQVADLSDAGYVLDRYYQYAVQLLGEIPSNKRYQIDLSAVHSEAQEHIETSAINLSVYLELSLAEVKNLRTSLSSFLIIKFGRT